MQSRIQTAVLMSNDGMGREAEQEQLCRKTERGGYLVSSTKNVKDKTAALIEPNRHHLISRTRDVMERKES